jgi:hypothetical protein
MGAVPSRPALPARFMASGSRPSTGVRVRRRTVGRRTATGLAAAVAALLAGCAAVPVWRQERVSKPNMVFNDRGAFVYGPRLNAQIESGSADNGGATAAGCTACK